MSLWIRLLPCLLLVGILTGCGGEAGQKTASITGEVKQMSGAPVGDVTVVFHPEKGQPVVTKTDAAGKFTVSAPLGPCKVAVIAQAEATADSSPESATKMQEKQNRVKPQYASPESSGLSVTVTDKQTDKLVFVVQ